MAGRPTGPVIIDQTIELPEVTSREAGDLLADGSTQTDARAALGLSQQRVQQPAPVSLLLTAPSSPLFAHLGDDKGGPARGSGRVALDRC